MRDTRRRVVVTGLGTVSCLGMDPVTLFENLVEGVSGIRPHPALPGEAVGWVEYEPADHFSRSQLFTMDRVSQLAVLSARQAVAAAGLAPRKNRRTGVLFGCSFGGAQTLEESYASYFGARRGPRKLSIPMTMSHAPSAQVSIHLGVEGESQSYSTACSSSAVAIGEGMRRIRDGYLDVAIAGGAESMLVPGVVGEWQKLGVLARPEGEPSTGCRPFTAGRNGFHLSEGAATLVLEERDHAMDRGAPILAEITGYGVSNDAFHITRPHADGQCIAIRNALADAGLEPEQIGHINAHGTSTPAGDCAEAASLRKVFGSHLDTTPLSATKASHGHCIGSSGALEAAVTVMALNRALAPPVPFQAEIDELAPVDLVMGAPRSLAGVDHAMSNSFAFGGNNAVLIISRNSAG